MDLRIPVLVYDQAGLAKFLNTLRGSGLLFNATNVSSTVFSDSATWTASQINQFRVFVIGSSDHINPAGLLANTNVGATVNGNQVITGLHIEHVSTGGAPQGTQFLINGIQYAAQGAGKTGLFASTDGCGSCFGTSGTNTAWLDNAKSFLKDSQKDNIFGSSSAQIKVSRGASANNIVIPSTTTTHPVNSGSGLVGGQSLTNANLSNWNQSAHSTFSNPPAATGYQVIQRTSSGAAVTLVKPAP